VRKKCFGGRRTHFHILPILQILALEGFYGVIEPLLAIFGPSGSEAALKGRETKKDHQSLREAIRAHIIITINEVPNRK
jgi:hypothetical protein